MQIIWQCATKAFKDNWIKTLTNSCNMQISDSTIPGLYLRYYAKTGQISFYLAYRNSITRKQRHMLIGRYSDFKLSEIKDRAQEMRKIIATGEDPIEIREQKRKAQQREQETRLTVKQVFGEYMEKYSRVYKKPSTQRSDIQEFNAYIANRLGDRYIKELEEKDMIEAYTAWVQATSFSTANKTLSLFSSMWDWCETYKYVPRGSNPCRYVKKGSNEKFKAVVLDLAGYKKLFNALVRANYQNLGKNIPYSMEYLNKFFGNLLLGEKNRLDDREMQIKEIRTKTTQKTTQKILNMLAKNPSATRADLAKATGLSTDGVKWNLDKLKESGQIRRIGPDRGGHWVILKG